MIYLLKEVYQEVKMKDIIKRAYEEGLKYTGEGKSADYIPILSKADPNHVGVVFIDKDGESIKLWRCGRKVFYPKYF